MSYVEAIEYASPSQRAAWEAHKKRRRDMHSFYQPPPPRPIMQLPKPAPEEPLEGKRAKEPEPDNVVELPLPVPTGATIEQTYIFVRSLVAAAYGVPDYMIDARNRVPKYSMPRHVTAYLMRVVVKGSYTHIAKLMQRKDHSTIIHSYTRVCEMVETDNDLRDKLAVLSERVRSWMANS